MKYTLGFEETVFVLSNEEEMATSFFGSYGKEKSCDFDDLTIEIPLSFFCYMKEEDYELIKLWLKNNAEAYMRAEKQKRDEEQERRDEQRNTMRGQRTKPKRDLK